MLTPAQLADGQGRIRNWEEAHPATQTASLNSLPTIIMEVYWKGRARLMTKIDCRLLLFSATCPSGHKSGKWTFKVTSSSLEEDHDRQTSWSNSFRGDLIPEHF